MYKRAILLKQRIQNDPIEPNTINHSTPNHVEITKILSTSQRESRVIKC